MSNQSPLRTLKGTLRGDLIDPGDARYDEVRKVYNGMIDKRPLAIAMCLDVADVSAAVLAGADHGLPVPRFAAAATTPAASVSAMTASSSTCHNEADPGRSWPRRP